MNRITRALLFGTVIAVILRAADNNRRVSEMYRSDSARLRIAATPETQQDMTADV